MCSVALVPDPFPTAKKSGRHNVERFVNEFEEKQACRVAADVATVTAN